MFTDDNGLPQMLVFKVYKMNFTCEICFDPMRKCFMCACACVCVCVRACVCGGGEGLVLQG